MSYTSQSFDREIIRLLNAGGVGFMPSDTIYGLSCLALDEQAVARLHQIKHRDNRPFIVLIANTKMLNLLSISENEVEPAKQYWPGAFTLVCSAAKAPSWLHMGTKTLAVRIPKNNSLLQLIDSVGPIISTSANLTGQPPIENIAAAQKIFGEQLDFYVDQGPVSDPPSTIAKLTNGQFEILRHGAVTIEQKEQA